MFHSVQCFSSPSNFQAFNVKTVNIQISMFAKFSTNNWRLSVAKNCLFYQGRTLRCNYITPPTRPCLSSNVKCTTPGWLGLRTTKMMIWRFRLWLFIVLFLQSDSLSLSLSLSLPASLLSRAEQTLGQRESREAGEIRRDLSDFDTILTSWGWVRDSTLQTSPAQTKLLSQPAPPPQLFCER